jgi:hypothetical protein
MHGHLKWSASEKKVARRAFDAALAVNLAKVMAEFKRRAETAKMPEDMWQVEDYLRQQRKEIDSVFDYRYSQLLWVLADLINQGQLKESQLAGLSEEKRELIRRAFVHKPTSDLTGHETQLDE